MAIVQQGQNLRDIAIQHCGSAESLFDLALLNNLSPTDEVAAGTFLQIPGEADIDMVNYLADEKQVVATHQDASKFIKPQGIGYWFIGVDFKVS